MSVRLCVVPDERLEEVRDDAFEGKVDRLAENLFKASTLIGVHRRKMLEPVHTLGLCEECRRADEICQSSEVHVCFGEILLL